MVVAGARKKAGESSFSVLVLEAGNTRATLGLRNRYYNPEIGRFNRLDPFAGDTTAPLSLHKYNYGEADPVNNIDPTGWFSLSGQLSVTGIQGIIQQGIGTISAVVRAYNTASRILDIIDYGRTVIGLLGALAQPTPQAAAAALVTELRKQIPSTDLTNILNGFNRAIQSIANDWDDIAANLGAKANQIAQEASVEGLRRLPSYLKAQAEGRLKLVFFAPSGPGDNRRDRYIDIGNDVQVGVSSGGGRLFGFGIRTSKRADGNVDQVFRIDYWDGRSRAEGRPTPTNLHVHYHIYGDGHPPGRTIYP